MRELAERAKEEFNARRAPEAVAEVLEVGDSFVHIRITGTGCRACGYDEHAVDFAFLLGDLLGTEVKVSGLEWEEEGLRATLALGASAQKNRA